MLGHHLATAWPLLISAIGVCMDMHSLHKMHCVDSHSLSVLLLLTLPRWEGVADGQMVSCMQVRLFSVNRHKSLLTTAHTRTRAHTHARVPRKSRQRRTYPLVLLFKGTSQDV